MRNLIDGNLHMKHIDKGLPSLIEESIKSTDLSDLASSLSEVGLDSLMKDGPLKDIPVIGTIMSIWNLGSTVQDHLFADKLISFLVAISEVDINERKKMIEEIEVNDDYKIKVGKKLLYIINRSEDHEVSSIVGKLYAARCKNILDYDEFLKASSIVTNVHSASLKDFLSSSPAPHPPSQEYNSITGGVLPTSRFSGDWLNLSDVGELAFTGLYIIRNYTDVIAVEETTIARKMRKILG